MSISEHFHGRYVRSVFVKLQLFAKSCCCAVNIYWDHYFKSGFWSMVINALSAKGTFYFWWPYSNKAVLQNQCFGYDLLRVVLLYTRQLFFAMASHLFSYSTCHCISSNWPGSNWPSKQKPNSFIEERHEQTMSAEVLVGFHWSNL